MARAKKKSLKKQEMEETEKAQKRQKLDDKVEEEEQVEEKKEEEKREEKKEEDTDVKEVDGDEEKEKSGSGKGNTTENQMKGNGIQNPYQPIYQPVYQPMGLPMQGGGGPLAPHLQQPMQGGGGPLAPHLQQPQWQFSQQVPQQFPQQFPNQYGMQYQYQYQPMQQPQVPQFMPEQFRNPNNQSWAQVYNPLTNNSQVSYAAANGNNLQANTDSAKQMLGNVATTSEDQNKPAKSNESEVKGDENVKQNEKAGPVAPAPGTSIFKHLSKQLREKILKLEFVELDQMFEPVGKKLKHDKNRIVISTNEKEGVDIANEKDERVIAGKYQWSHCFRIYSAVLLTKYPQWAIPLLQYNHNICRTADKYDWQAVAAYDRAFRNQFADDPVSNCWEKVDMQLWSTELLFNIPKGDSKPSKPFRSGDRVCYEFNRGSCTHPRCRFLHKCDKCSKFGHGAFECRTKNFTPRQAPHADRRGGNRR